MSRTLSLLCTSLLSLSIFLFAQAQNDASGFCETDRSPVIIDGVQQCREFDTLDRLIFDFEAAQAAADPYEAGNEGDRNALRLLPDVSPEAHAATRRQTEQFLKRHAALSVRQRDPAAQLNFDLLGYVLRTRYRRQPFDEARVPFTNDSGFFSEFSYIARQTRFESVEDYEAYVARLSAIPRYFGQHKSNLRRGIETNYTASREILPGIINTIRNLSEQPATRHPFFQPFTHFPDNFSEDDKANLRQLGEAAMENAVLPAYRDLLTFMEDEYVSEARNEIGIGGTPEGRAHYVVLVKYYTTLDITPDEVHNIGLREVRRIRSEMDAIIERTGFEGSFVDFLDFLRTDEQFYADTPEQLLKEAAWFAKQADGKMPEFFGTLPRISYGVIPVPDEMAPHYTTGRYWPGNPKLGKAGNYVVNTYDLKQRPLYNLPALTLHEGVPGHHHQISLGQELSGLPKFRRNLYLHAFGEGWGLYAEKLGVEMGLYKTPYENFGRLTYEMWRACRLVVDTGIHWKGWSRERAEACFFENSALAPHNIKTEIERYISWPGQALAYKIGELKIIQLRERAEVELGEKFSIRDFHDAILLEGSLPLNILEARIDAWIAEEKIR
ncbi:MAG: DUF885 family protein [Hyphomonadaceae bacterium]|nr:DUF885 family protein [Hyphomonadaceae bacterium]MBC6412234.1 DUF885 family protein [Hyphomonadaceae bacterium]